MIELDQLSKTPLYVQIYEQMRRGIAAGLYPPASKLPPIRGLAANLRCSRNTVETAYQLLVEEGFVTGRQGSGFIVGGAGAEAARHAALEHERHRNCEQDGTAKHPFDAERFAAPADEPEHDIAYNFTYGSLQQGTFPAAAWKALLNDILSECDDGSLDSYSGCKGEPGLIQAIARRLYELRGVSCRLDQMVICAGTQGCLQGLLMMFDPARDAIAIEEPGYSGARSVFEANRFALRPCPVDPGDPDVFLEALERSDAKLVYTTPSNQFPLGATMPLEMREQLLRWAERNDAYIIEDDYCHEFCYDSRPLRSLYALDGGRRVIYLGTSSKSLSPALRISCLILPEPLVNRWDAINQHSYSEVPWLMQETLRRFMEGDTFLRHLRRMQTTARRKRDALLDAIDRHLGNRVRILGGNAGLHLLLDVPGERDQDELSLLAQAAGVRVYNTDQYWLRDEHALKNCVLIGFSAIPEKDIEPGIAALAGAWFG